MKDWFNAEMLFSGSGQTLIAQPKRGVVTLARKMGQA